MADVELNTLGSVIKVAYEAEADTDAYTDTEKSKLATVSSDGGSVSVENEGTEIIAEISTLTYGGNKMVIYLISSILIIGTILLKSKSKSKPVFYNNNRVVNKTSRVINTQRNRKGN